MTAHIKSNGSQFLTAGFLVYLTYRVSKNNGELGYYRTVLLEVAMNSELLHIKRSNESHLLTAGKSYVPVLGTSNAQL